MPDNYIAVPSERGTVYISDEVIAAIVGTAISETEGVAGLTNASGMDFGEFIGLKSVSRGISVGFENGVVHVGAAIYARYGDDSISAIGERAQKAASAAVESMTGLKSEVNIHVAGVSFER